MSSDGSNIVQLTNQEMATGPAWSPDGKRIVFECLVHFTQICVMDNDGSNGRQLTEGSWANFSPAWSPDGTKIAFVSNREFEHSRDIFVMNVDGSHVIQLTTDIASEDTSPSWSANGQQIVFSCDDGICVISLKDKSIRKLIDDGFNPAWAPAP